MRHSSDSSNQVRRERELWKRQDCTFYPFRYLSPCRCYLDAEMAPVNPRIISYRQVGICKGFEAASGPVTSKPDEGYAFFKIETVDNTKSGQSFRFRSEACFY